MSSIKFNQYKFPQSNIKDRKYVRFADLSLDLRTHAITKDLIASYDEDAIKNSLRNILHTRPGENFLFPDFGLNLERYLFDPISVAKGESLGNKVLNTITKYEPRVRVSAVNVEANIDLQEYRVSILVEIPSISRTLEIRPIFRQDEFYME